MKNTMLLTKLASGMIILVATLLVVSCESGTITSPEAQTPDSSEINWITWNDEVLSDINALDRRGSQTKLILADIGGTVGNGSTFKNSVAIPAGALPHDEYITVTVVDIENNQQSSAAVDFLPSMDFLADVEVTLSWEFTNHDDWDCLESEDCVFDIYVVEYDEFGNEYPVLLPTVITVDYQQETVSFFVDHFTRFAWGLGSNTGTGGDNQGN